jgi:hypothetical protein
MATCSFERDCLKFPFPKDCHDFCVEQILRRINPQQKIEILGISPDTAQALYRIYNRNNISSYADLIRYLTPAQVSEIKQVFQNITNEQLRRLRLL